MLCAQEAEELIFTIGDKIS